MRQKDLRCMFGKSREEWLRVCLGYSQKLDDRLLHSYRKKLMLERMEYVWVRKRFRREARIWAKVYRGV